MSDRPAPFDGPQWEGWEPMPAQESEGAIKDSFIVWSDGLLTYHTVQKTWDHVFSTTEAARQVAECIIAAENGEQVGPVGELVEALREALRAQVSVAMRASYDGDHDAEDRADKKVRLTRLVLAKYEAATP